MSRFADYFHLLLKMIPEHAVVDRKKSKTDQTVEGIVHPYGLAAIHGEAAVAAILHVFHRQTSNSASGFWETGKL